MDCPLTGVIVGGLLVAVPTLAVAWYNNRAAAEQQRIERKNSREAALQKSLIDHYSSCFLSLAKLQMASPFHVEAAITPLQREAQCDAARNLSLLKFYAPSDEARTRFGDMRDKLLDIHDARSLSVTGFDFTIALDEEMINDHRLKWISSPGG